MIVSPGVLWMRAGADAGMLVVCEDAVGGKQQQPARASCHEDRALRNVATRCGDGDVDQSPHALWWEMVLSQAPHQRVGDECRRRLMSMLSCAINSSAAPSAALAAATERPSAVSAAMAEWGPVGYGAPNTNCDYYERVEGPRVWVARTGDEAFYRGTRIP